MNFDAQINLPFLGSLSIGQFLIVCASLYFGWPFLPSILSGLRSGLVALLKKEAPQIEAVAVKAIEAAIPPNAAAAIEALQKLTAWAVANGSPELVDQVAGLFRQLQSHFKAPPK